MALVSIIITIRSLAIDKGLLPTTHFDPSNPLHLIVASSAGGLDGAFTGIDENGMQLSETVNLRLGLVDKQGVGFLHIET